ncbi:MAG: sodium:proton antiporter [candidate division FCPU426 bacterium]
MVAGAPSFWAELSFGEVMLFILPFTSLLMMIAVFPLFPGVAKWWENNRNKLLVSALCGVAGVLLFYLPTRDLNHILINYLEYLDFILLLAALYVTSGGIYISGAFAGLPRINTAFLAIGAVLANFLGTTGASMLLLRPLIRANRLRKHKVHLIIFFIFIVSNCGGLLTPLGDPPLYLGFLRGMPFAWTLRLFPEWLFIQIILLSLFFFMDHIIFRREDEFMKRDLEAEIAAAEKKLHIQGQRNLWFLLLIMATVLFAGYFLQPRLENRLPLVQAEAWTKIFQAAMLAGIAWFSFRLTPAHLHERNHFNFHPIQEVAALFFGIFGAMLPALAVLAAKAPEFHLTQPWQYFWSSGLLSSFLDNAPTYLTFSTLACSSSGISADSFRALALQFPRLLEAISCGAVFMGALTYIGNGPNFMVKSMAEHAHIKMPSFGGYMLWSFGILLPIFILQTLLFFR